MRRTSRTSLREHRLAVKAQLESLGIMGGKPAAEYTTRIPEKRAPRKPTGERLEWQILREILRYLRSHPKVAICWRMQSGIFQRDDRQVRVGVTGMPDIVGMTKDGRLFGIEVKSERGRLTDSQTYWLDTIRHFGGRAGVARCAEDANEIICS